MSLVLIDVMPTPQGSARHGEQPVNLPPSPVLPSSDETELEPPAAIQPTQHAFAREDMQQPHCAAVAESTVRLKMTRQMITIEVAEALCDNVDKVQMDRPGMDKAILQLYAFADGQKRRFSDTLSSYPSNEGYEDYQEGQRQSIDWKIFSANGDIDLARWSISAGVFRERAKPSWRQSRSRRGR
ncbi:Os07g0429500 [Oryza sativa Japonica Group]|uniref:Os07g0429500 protein n=1 Tax=Oryza sativa subsp. japonica TaxID=39947 RepID=C7J533_ORYSJ|nr:Os07g0429500 [Oryza sativa Japonica Group]|eukprot:NP_001175167.1 Os07g0429500 [Oryza sativa Japonica Group]